jgi:DNA-binding NarL/FixJ family response regulator
MNKRITIFVVDSSVLMAEALSALCRQIPGVRVLGWTANGRDALTHIRRLRPSIAIVDITICGLTAKDLATHIRVQAPSTRLIVFSDRPDPRVFFFGADTLPSPAISSRARLPRSTLLSKRKGQGVNCTVKQAEE